MPAHLVPVLVDRRLPSGSSHGREKEGSAPSSFSYRDTTFMIPFKFNYFPQAPLPIPSHQELGHQHTDLGVYNRQNPMEKEMAPHSSTLAWKIPWMEEPGRLQSMGLQRVRHDWATSLSLFTFLHWRRKWQSTPVLLHGESQGWRRLVGCRLWGCTESDTTEAT